MPTLEIATTTILANEPAWSLREFNWHKQGTNEVHRYQAIRVARNDGLVTWEEDLGLASRWPFAKTFFIIGGEVRKGKGYVFETVGRLRGIADEMRNRTREEWNALYRTFDAEKPTIDFENKYYDAIEMRRKGKIQ